MQVNIFVYNFSWSLSSKGKRPQTIAYKIIPDDQISVFNPQYFLPNIISGAAYDGEPHGVDNNWSSIYSLDSPKSIIVKILFALINKFSGFKSRWVMPFLCIYSKPWINWQ